MLISIQNMFAMLLKEQQLLEATQNYNKNIFVCTPWLNLIKILHAEDTESLDVCEE